MKISRRRTPDFEPFARRPGTPATSADAPLSVNEQVAAHLEEVGRLIAARGAHRFRAGAWSRAARILRATGESVAGIVARRGIAGLDRLPAVSRTIARAIAELVATGRLGILDRLRADTDPEALLATVPGIGRGFARRIERDLGIQTLEDLEAAARDGRLARIRGFGSKRVAGVREALAGRLARVRVPVPPPSPEAPVREILDVDREYREGAAAGTIPRIAPRRFNPRRERWLPVLHTVRDGRRYTALFSNTARAHERNATRDWVVVHAGARDGERTYTVVGRPDGSRVVRGREDESAAPPWEPASRWSAR